MVKQNPLTMNTESQSYLQSLRVFADSVPIAKCAVWTHSDRRLTSVRYILMETTIATTNIRTDRIQAVRVKAAVGNAQRTFVDVFA